MTTTDALRPTSASAATGRRTHPALSGLLRGGIVALALATAAIHASLGGLLFLLNAIGYTVLALAMLVPGPLRPLRWMMRLALAGFTLTTIVAWVLVGARFQLAYVDKAIEVALFGLVAIDVWHADGGPIGVARRAAALLATVRRRLSR